MSLRNKQIKFALLLSIITVFYNIIEGALCIFFGLEHETLVLFGFGLDSFVEVISGVGIWHMVLRIMKNENENKDNFERTALKVTAAAFYVLAIGLFFTAIFLTVIILIGFVGGNLNFIGGLKVVRYYK